MHVVVPPCNRWLSFLLAEVTSIKRACIDPVHQAFYCLRLVQGSLDVLRLQLPYSVSANSIRAVSGQSQAVKLSSSFCIVQVTSHIQTGYSGMTDAEPSASAAQPSTGKLCKMHAMLSGSSVV